MSTMVTADDNALQLEAERLVRQVQRIARDIRHVRQLRQIMKGPVRMVRPDGREYPPPPPWMVAVLKAAASDPRIIRQAVPDPRLEVTLQGDR